MVVTKACSSYLGYDNGVVFPAQFFENSASDKDAQCNGDDAEDKEGDRYSHESFVLSGNRCFQCGGRHGSQMEGTKNVEGVEFANLFCPVVARNVHAFYQAYARYFGWRMDVSIRGRYVPLNHVLYLHEFAPGRRCLR